MTIIKNMQVFEQKIAALKKSHMHIVADFDKTLTHATYEGEKHHSTIALVRDGNYLSEEYVQKSHALFDKYHPIEIDESLEDAERTVAMYAWWSEHLKLMIDCGMSKEVIRDIVEKNTIYPRQGLNEFFTLLAKHNIPVLILSAGLGDIIAGFLIKNKLRTPNITLLANFFTFNANGKATGYDSAIIHTFNKHETELTQHDFSKHNQVILLGDSIGDLAMTANTNHALELRIGFANDPDQELFFAKKFDMVITNDGSLEPVNDMLKTILNVNE